MSSTELLTLPKDVRDAAIARVAERLTRELPRTIRTTLTDDPYRQPGPTDDVISAMAAMAGHRAAILDQASTLVDPGATPDDALAWLASWFGWGWLFRDPFDPRRLLDLDRAFPPGPQRLRDLISAWPMLNRLRGRDRGLLLTLRTATGLTDITLSVSAGQQHLTVHAPSLPVAWTAWLRRLIQAERPAHLTWTLVTAEDAT